MENNIKLNDADITDEVKRVKTKDDSIPVQKVKDKIEENKRLIDETYSEDIIQKLTDENEILEELLEDK